MVSDKGLRRNAADERFSTACRLWPNERNGGGCVMLRDRNIAVIGGGKMGGALVEGMISRGGVRPSAVTVSDALEERRAALGARCGVKVTADNRTAVRDADVVILAVKPQNMGEVIDGLAGELTVRPLILSIAAGIGTAFIEERCPAPVRVVRVMPNTPAMIGAGAAALSRGKNATAADLALGRHIFDAVGVTVEVEEPLIDVVTGLSGSGPAYAFLFIEALTEAGVGLGLAPETALLLASQTLLGAAKLCLQGERSPAELREMVTSPGGTTLEGLKVLTAGGFRETVAAAVAAATARSRELGQQQR
jgi:pyrroline-5-carboxylate reductase